MPHPIMRWLNASFCYCGYGKCVYCPRYARPCFSEKEKKPCCSGKKSAISCHTQSSFLCTFTPSFLSFVAGLSGFRPVRTGARPMFARPQLKTWKHSVPSGKKTEFTDQMTNSCSSVPSFAIKEMLVQRWSAPTVWGSSDSGMNPVRFMTEEVTSPVE